MDKKYWIAALAALGIIDYYAAFHKGGGTLSQAFREVFRTDTTLGKALWICFCIAFIRWFVPHILNWPEVRESLEFLDNVIDS